MIFNNSIWLDEAFSLSMIKQSYIDIIKNTAIDVHPPLYYILLKSIVSILKIFGEINVIWCSKLISILPIVILIIISYKEIAKLFGKKVAFLFNLLILGMPQIIQYGIEIRMYSLGMLFVTLVYISCIKWRKENTNKELYKMAIFAVLAAYTHYFAAVSVACVYVVLLIEILLKKDYEKLKKLLFSMIVMLLYLPWIIILIKQVLVVKESYWIGAITKNTIKTFFQYPYTIEGNSILTSIVAIILLISIIPIKNTNNKQAIYGFIVPIGTIIIGVTASKLIRPVFISRYMVCGLGCLWLAVAIKLTNILKKEYMYYIVIVVVLVVTLWSNYGIIEKENVYKKEQLKLVSYINSIDIDDFVVIFDSNQLQRILVYYYPNIENYVYKEKITQLTKQVYKQTNMQILDDIHKINNMQKNIYIFAMKEDILKEITNNNYTYEECGNYIIETYKFSIYKVYNNII